VITEKVFPDTCHVRSPCIVRWLDRANFGKLLPQAQDPSLRLPRSGSGADGCRAVENRIRWSSHAGGDRSALRHPPYCGATHPCHVCAKDLPSSDRECRSKRRCSAVADTSRDGRLSPALY